MDKPLHNSEFSNEEKEFFAQSTPVYDRSKEEVWAAISDAIDEKKTKVISLNTEQSSDQLYDNGTDNTVAKTQKWTWLAAAVILMVSTFALFSFQYTNDIEALAGEVQTVTLPDESVVTLNAGTSLSFKPFWWNFDRAVSLDGEAFFEVEKGSIFTVYSEQGSTSVLGTSFNVYARDGDYKVYCKTGKVAVSNFKSEIIIFPGEIAVSKTDRALTKKMVTNEVQALAWRMDKFVFNSTPIEMVLKDFERTYNVEITIGFDVTKDRLYTGLFDRSVKIEEALEIVCHSFDLQYEKTNSDTSFIIKE